MRHDGEIGIDLSLFVLKQFQFKEGYTGFQKAKLFHAALFWQSVESAIVDIPT